MILITIPTADVSILKQQEPEGSHIYGFTEFHLIPRDRGGIFMFYNDKNELLFVGKARKLRPRIKKHFEDSVSAIRMNRDEVAKIDVCIVDNPVHREIYETFIINELRSKYNQDKVFFE